MVVEDVSLELPALPTLGGPALPLHLSPLRIDGDSIGTSFSMTNGMLTMAGDQSDGVDDVRMHALRIARGIRAHFDGDVPAPRPSVRVTPLGIERIRDRGTMRITERLVVAPEHPAALLEWTVETVNEPPAFSVVRVEWEIDLERLSTRSLRWRSESRALIARAEPAGDVACFVFSALPDTWLIEDASTPDSPRIRCTVAARLAPRVPLRFAIVGAAADDQLRATLVALDQPAALLRVRAARLRRLRDDHIAIDTPEPDIDNALEWTKTSLISLQAGPRSNTNLVLALLAIGEFDGARDLTRSIGAHDTGMVTEESLDRLRACHQAWTGELERGERPLPPLPGLLADTFGRCLADFTAGRSECAYSLLHADLRRALEHPAAIPPETATTIVAGLVYGLLGAEPDAPRTRLRLRPQIPASWDHSSAANLAMADARIAFRYHRDGARHTFQLQQTAGRVPVRLIFEPALPATTLRRASVDGSPAHLDPRPFGERILVPIQLVLDHQRTIVFETEPT